MKPTHRIPFTQISGRTKKKTKTSLLTTAVPKTLLSPSVVETQSEVIELDEIGSGGVEVESDDERGPTRVSKCRPFVVAEPLDDLLP